MKNRQEQVAIVGMAIRCPGAQNVGEFWSNLRNGVESISFASDEELRELGTPEALLKSPTFIRASAPLEGLELFDAGFFQYSAKEAEYIDPQQRVFLELSVEALESAGIDPERYPGSIGMFAGEGQLLYGYQFLGDRSLIGVERHMAIIGNDKDYLATRASFKLGLRGPSFTLQCACSTSTVAMHLAAQSLQARECDVAMAGGVSVSWIRGKSGYHFVEGGILSRDGHTRPFDADASGTVFADGTALVVLKRLDDAIADGDDIQAVIVGTAINNDGASKDSYTAPSIDGQVDVMARALETADISPETIGYIEAHGTGTAIGDPIEIESLQRVFRTVTDRNQFCGVGSLKSNIGHLNTISGLAGTIKAALCCKTGEIPASLHFENPNPKIDFVNSPFYVPTALTEWNTEGPRRACISAFGIGGTNSVVILEEPPRVESNNSSKSLHVATITAKSEAAVDAASTRLAEHLRTHPQENIADVCHTLVEGRSQYPYVRAVVCNSAEDATNALESGPPIEGVRSVPSDPVTFLFPGQGSQHVFMGRELYKEEPVFAEELDRCAEALADVVGIDLRKLLFPENDSKAEEAENLLKETRYTQPAIFAVSYALAQTWIGLGVRPTMAIGHSIGEFVAACLAQVFSLEDALRAVAERGKLIQSMPGGKMLAIMKPADEVQPLLPETISLAAVNAPLACVASGTHEDIAALAESLEEKGLSSTLLHTSHAFHSHMMEPAAAEFVETMKGISLSAPVIPYVSNVTGDWITDEQATDPTYWASHMRQAVLFHKGLSCIHDRGESIYLEVGPGRTLGTLTKALGPDVPAISSLPHAAARGTGEAKAFLQAAAELWTRGVAVDWSRRYEGERRVKRPLPTYPFERERYWVLPDLAPTPPPVEEETQDTVPGAPISGAATSSEAKGMKGANSGAAAVKLPTRDASRYLVQTATWKRLQYTARSETKEESDLAWLVFAAQEGVDAQFTKVLRETFDNVTHVKKGRVYSDLGDGSFSCNLNREDDLGELCALVANRLDEGQRLRVVYFCDRSRQRKTDKPASRYRREVNDKIISPINLIRSLTQHISAEHIGLTIVTREGQEVSGTEAIEPMMALPMGPCLASMHEYPGLNSRIVDVAAKPQSVDGLARALAADLAEPRQGVVTAYRGSARWVRTIDRIPPFLRKEPQRAFREKGVYMITGGLGALGLAVSMDLARRYGARLVLTGRTEMPPRDTWPDILEDAEDEDRVVRMIRGIQEVEAAGGEVMTGVADVCDLAQMEAVVQAATEKFGAIHGVIHAAGVPGTTPIGLKTPDEVDAVLRPKLLGLAVLEQVFSAVDLDFLALFSSTSAIWGRVGQVDYTAANAYLDAYAIQHWGRGGWPVVSINWDNWREVGMAVDTHASGPGQPKAVPGLDTVDAVYAFGEALVARQPQLIVRAAPKRPKGRARPGAGARAGGGKSKEAAPKKQEPKAYPRPALAEPYQEPESEIETTLAAVWTKLLRIAPIGRNDNFFELGGHSLMGLQLLPSVRDKYQVALDPRELFENPTIAKLADAIEAKRSA